MHYKDYRLFINSEKKKKNYKRLFKKRNNYRYITLNRPLFANFFAQANQLKIYLEFFNTKIIK